VALQLFHQSANQNYAEAQCRLGIIYSDGCNGIEKDPAVAVKWFRLTFFKQAAELGNPKAQCYLGFFYLHGIACCQNTETAFLWIMAACDSGQPIVFQILQYFGLDIGRLCAGYQRSQGIWAMATANRFGTNSVYCSPAKTALTPIPPG
jgi:hypothetical protein